MNFSNMIYSNLTSNFSAIFADKARVCTRYNTAVTEEKARGMDFRVLQAKLAVVDYDSSKVSFHLKIVQIECDTVVPSKAFSLEQLLLEDSTVRGFDDIDEALEYSGLSKTYRTVLCDIVAHCNTFDIHSNTVILDRKSVV